MSTVEVDTGRRLFAQVAEQASAGLSPHPAVPVGS